MKYFWWDGCNKWLYFGTKQGQANQFAFMLDNWYFWFHKGQQIRHWTLFEIMWDNGAFWGDLPEIKTVKVNHMNGKYIEQENWVQRTGQLLCFFQVTIVGIGLRYWYNKPMTVYHKCVLQDVPEKEEEVK